MNHIVYGYTQVSKNILRKAKEKFSLDEIIYVDGKGSLDEMIATTLYRPFFSPRWFVQVNLDKLEKEDVMRVMTFLKNDKVKLYLTIDKKGDLYHAIRKSPTIQNMKDLVILNAKFPDEKYIITEILRRVHKQFDDGTLKYLCRNLKFNIDKLEEYTNRINEVPTREITLTEVKKIVPQSKTKSVRELCYAILLSRRGDLKPKWRELNSIVVGNSGTKKKPFQIVENLTMDVKYLTNIIIKNLTEIVRIKTLYLQGVLTENNVFDKKEKLESKITYLKAMTIPTIRNHILVSSEVSLLEIKYCLNEFLLLRGKTNLTEEDLYLTIMKLLKR